MSQFLPHFASENYIGENRLVFREGNEAGKPDKKDQRLINEALRKGKAGPDPNENILDRITHNTKRDIAERREAALTAAKARKAAAEATSRAEATARRMEAPKPAAKKKPVYTTSESGIHDGVIDQAAVTSASLEEWEARAAAEKRAEARARRLEQKRANKAAQKSAELLAYGGLTVEDFRTLVGAKDTTKGISKNGRNLDLYKFTKGLQRELQRTVDPTIKPNGIVDDRTIRAMANYASSAADRGGKDRWKIAWNARGVEKLDPSHTHTDLIAAADKIKNGPEKPALNPEKNLDEYSGDNLVSEYKDHFEDFKTKLYTFIRDEVAGKGGNFDKEEVAEKVAKYFDMQGLAMDRAVMEDIIDQHTDGRFDIFGFQDACVGIARTDLLRAQHNEARAANMYATIKGLARELQKARAGNNTERERILLGTIKDFALSRKIPVVDIKDDQDVDALAKAMIAKDGIQNNDPRATYVAFYQPRRT